MNKKLAVFMSAIMVVGVVSGCGQAPAVSSTVNSGAVESKLNEAVKKEEPRELTIARPDTGVDNVSFNDGLEIWTEIEKRLDLKIKWEVLAGDQYNTNAQTRLAAGQNLPDIIQIPGSMTEGVKYAKQGQIIKLNELIDANEDMTNFLADYPDVRKGITDPNGNIFFISNYLLDAPNGRGMAYRKDWTDQLGLKEPKTIDDWYNMMKAFKENPSLTGGNGEMVPYGGSPRAFYSAFGLTVQQDDNVYFYKDDSGRIVYDAMRDGFKEYLTFANKLYNEGMLDPMFGSGQTQITDLLNKNQVGSTFANPGDCDNFANSIKATGTENAQFTWTFSPVDTNGKNRWAPLPTVRGGVLMGISKDCKNPTLAMEFLGYVWANKEGARTTMMGIEGKHWDMVDGVPTFKDEMLNDPQYNIILMCRRIGGFLFMDIQTKEFNLARGVGEYKNGLAMIINNEKDLAQALPVFIPSEEENAAIQASWPDIKSYIDEMTFKFIMGTESLDKFDKFRDKLKNLGVEELTAIYQTIYDRYVG